VKVKQGFLVCDFLEAFRLLLRYFFVVKLKTLLALVFVSVGVLLLLLVSNSFISRKKANELAEAQLQKYHSYQLADELRQSSDDLTRMARTYAVTGNEKYQKFFNRILTIRNGETPRPQDYNDIYWDLVTGDAEQDSAEAGEKISLESRMLSAGFTVQEFALLKDSQNQSDSLVKLENIAMHALKGEFDDGTGTFQIKKTADQPLAIQILHSQQYHEAKAKIMKPLRDFTQMVNQRTSILVSGLQKEVHRRVQLGLVLALALLGLLSIGYTVILRLVLRPIRLLSLAVQQLEQGKFAEIQSIRGVRELNQLVTAFNQMASILHQREKEKEAAMVDLGEKATALEKEKGRTEKLLLNVLPIAIADRLQKGEKVEAETFPEVTVLFADVVGFTKLAAELGPRSVTNLLNELFEIFDDLAEKYKLEKIKTIGDCYMAVAGVPDRSPTHAQQMADFSLEALSILKSQNQKLSRNLQIRIGMHSGTVAAGIIGRKKFAYDLWGDVVNITSRLEGTAEPMKIHVSESVHARLEDSYLFEERGEVELKNRGKLRTYYLVGKKAERMPRAKFEP
jgi:class 3 adenylate cyclase/CHASE3 domain sensor protein